MQSDNDNTSCNASQVTAFDDALEYDIPDDILELDIPERVGTPGSITSGTTFSQADSTLTLPSFPIDPSNRGDSIWDARTSTRRSWIWRHGDSVKEGGKKYWKCVLCTRTKRYADDSTKHPIDHLRKVHRLTEQGPIPQLDTSNSAIHRAFNTTVPQINFNIDIFKQLLLQWMVHYHVSFRQVEEPTFRLLLTYLCSISASHIAISRALPKSGNTIRAWLLSFYTNQKNFLISYFSNVHIVHFTFDM